MIPQRPILRALPEIGHALDDPSAEGLLMLLDGIEAGTAGTSLVVERTADLSGNTYAQAARRRDGSYIVEYRDGDAASHYGTVAPDWRTAHELLTGWAFQRPGWRDRATWSPVRLS